MIQGLECIVINLVHVLTRIHELSGFFLCVSSQDPGANERRDSRPVPMELQLKPPAFERAKGTGEDKMRSSYY